MVQYRGVEQLVARRAHNPEVEGSSPSPATINQAASWLPDFFLKDRMFPVFFSFQGALQDVLGGAAGRFRGRRRTFQGALQDVSGARAFLPIASVKWKVLIMRQIIKQGQQNFRVFFHDFADSQRVTFYALHGRSEEQSKSSEAPMY